MVAAFSPAHRRARGSLAALFALSVVALRAPPTQGAAGALEVLAPRTALERTARQLAAWRSVPAGRVEASGGVVRSQFFIGARVKPDAPERMAREYISKATRELGMSDGLDKLELLRVESGIGTTHVRFRQTWRGLPVYRAQVVVSLAADEPEVRAVTSDYQPGIDLPDIMPSVTSLDATGRARARIGAALADAPDSEHELMVFARGGTAWLVWRVAMAASDPLGDWEVLVDAKTGGIVQVRDLLCRSTNVVGAPGLGFAFNPDPITTAGVPYGTPGYADNGNADSPQLTAARRRVPLFWLTPQTLPGPPPHDTWKLAGPYVSVQDIALPAGWFAPADFPAL